MIGVNRGLEMIVPASFTRVIFEDVFWKPRLCVNEKVTLPYVMRRCQETGRIDNFVKAAGGMEGPHEGLHFNDSDLFKTIEGAAYSLAVRFDADLDNYLDELIDKIDGAQEHDGYIYTLRTIHDDAIPIEILPHAGAFRWSNLYFSHELYNVGHLYEAAVAHHQATGKRTLLEIAIRSADLIDEVFGPDAIHDVPGHEEIEIGLVKLFHVTKEQKYLDLAEFFLQQRGYIEARPESEGISTVPSKETLYDDPSYRQDHVPVVDQRSAIGHAVRAGYLYVGMADVALAYRGMSATGLESVATTFGDALQAIWQDVVSTKLYLTGGIGAHHEGEVFGDSYVLPNKTAYAETCAAIANVMWNHRMFLLSRSSSHIDVLERTLYNGLLSGIAMSGDRFFYPNPLASDGRYEFNRGEGATRSPWFYCSCCPTNLVRFLPTVPGYVYASEDDWIYVNLFVAGKATVETASGIVELIQRTRYPWDGDVLISVNPVSSAEFALAVRIPGWARDKPVPSDLYQYIDTGEDSSAMPLTITVNGTSVDVTADCGLVSGWVVIRRRWCRNDLVNVHLPMPVRRVVSHDAVVSNRGKVAVERGPLVFCAEGVDHDGTASDLTIEDGELLTAAFEPKLLGGITTIRRDSEVKRRPLKLIPYFAWSHRGTGEMAVWLRRKPSH